MIDRPGRRKEVFLQFTDGSLTTINHAVQDAETFQNVNSRKHRIVSNGYTSRKMGWSSSSSVSDIRTKIQRALCRQQVYDGTKLRQGKESENVCCYISDQVCFETSPSMTPR